MAKLGNVDAERLTSFVERIERLEEEKKAIADDVKDLYAEASAVGYDKKAIREVVKLRKMDSAERDEMEFMLDVYKKALKLTPDE